LVKIDPRDLEYKMIDRLKSRTSATPQVDIRHWGIGPILDQGNTSQCMAYAGIQFMTASPIRNRYHDQPAQLYTRCQIVDGFPIPHDGTTSRALMKVFMDEGYVREYNWVWDVATMVTWVANHAPILVGTDWHFGMEQTDQHDFIWPTGPVYGGHEWLICGVNRRMKCPDGSTGAFRMANSWGRAWSKEGRAWISFPSMAKLLDNYGDAVAPWELRNQFPVVDE
jgi:hypothetical protein